MTHSLEERFFSAIGYIGILFLVPLLLKGKSRFCQFHAKQGLALFIAWSINVVILSVPLLGWIVSLAGSVVLTILMVIAVIKAYVGEEWKMPYISALTRRLKL